jgi:hypothetical protein
LPYTYVWESAGEKRAYDTSIELEPIDSQVEFTFLQRGEGFFILMTSKKVYRTMRYRFVAHIAVTQDTICVDLIGIDGARAISEALGCALSEIPFDIQGTSFVLETHSKVRRVSILLCWMMAHTATHHQRMG